MDSSSKSIFSRLGDKTRNTRKTKQKDETPQRQDKKEKQDQEISLKITFLGDYCCGAKSSFILRYVRNEFSDSSETAVVASFMIKNVVSRGQNVKLEMWDIAGYERNDSLLPMYIRGADGIVAGYNITRSASIDVIRRKLPYIRLAPPDAVIMVIGNKTDLELSREVSWDEGDEFAREIGASLFFETSAKTGYNVNESMEAFIDKILENKGY